MKAVLTQVGRWVTFKTACPLCPSENCRAHLITGSSSLVVFSVYSSGKMAQLVMYLPPEQNPSLIPECPEHWVCWPVHKARAGEAGMTRLWASSLAGLVSPKTRDLVSKEGSYPEDGWFPSTGKHTNDRPKLLFRRPCTLLNPNFTKPHSSVLKTISRDNVALLRKFISFTTIWPWKSLIFPYLTSQARWELISSQYLDGAVFFSRSVS